MMLCLQEKYVSNMSAGGSDEALRFVPLSILSLERPLEFIADDELVEVTPKSIRFRKIYLNKNQRNNAKRTNTVISKCK